ncbi:MAG: pitrilysin family protein [candidate division WOR-3 bacterium]
MKILIFLIFGNFNPPINSFVLKNKLNVYLVKNEISPIVTVLLAFRAGGEYQSPHDAGLFHLVEHMFFKGNKKYKTQEEFMEKIRELGILYNGATSLNYVIYYYTSTKENLKKVLEFSYNAITGILFDEKELEKERTVVLDEYNRDYSDPLENFYMDISRLFYEELYYKTDLLGPKYNILKADKKIMLNQYDKFYGPENCFLIISGDIDFEKTEKIVRKIFERWNKKVFYQKPEKLPELKTKKLLNIKSSQVRSARIEIIFRGPGTLYERKDTYIGDLVAKIFSLPYSPFQKEFVNTGLSSSATLSYYTKSATGEIYFSFELEKEKIEEVKKKIDELLNSIDDERWFPEEIIEDAKISIENEFSLKTENPEGFAHELAFWVTTADLDYFVNYINEIKKINKEDIKNFFNKYIKNKNFVMGIIEPEGD